MTENDGPTFCRRMRDATKAIHDTSDKLVNLKLGLSMSNDMVWANGLLVFAKVRFTTIYVIEFLNCGLFHITSGMLDSWRYIECPPPLSQFRLIS